jgi:hypothetical protein
MPIVHLTAHVSWSLLIRLLITGYDGISQSWRSGVGLMHSDWVQWLGSSPKDSHAMNIIYFWALPNSSDTS